MRILIVDAYILFRLKSRRMILHTSWLFFFSYFSPVVCKWCPYGKPDNSYECSLGDVELAGDFKKLSETDWRFRLQAFIDTDMFTYVLLIVISQFITHAIYSWSL